MVEPLKQIPGLVQNEVFLNQTAIFPFRFRVKTKKSQLLIDFEFRRTLFLNTSTFLPQMKIQPIGLP